MRIHKYVIPSEYGGEMFMPEGANIIHVGLDTSEIACIWAEMDITAPSEKRIFHIRGTGMENEVEWKYIQTFRQGSFIWHVYEEIQ